MSKKNQDQYFEICNNITSGSEQNAFEFEFEKDISYPDLDKDQNLD
jgi:hypothetical protein